MMKLKLFIPVTLIIVLASCEKCKDCYLIEVQGSVKTETLIGELCDQEIEDLEKHDLVCLSDDCYYKCK